MAVAGAATNSDLHDCRLDCAAEPKGSAAHVLQEHSMAKVAALVQAARELSPDERAELIERLMEVAGNPPDRVAQQWLELAQERMEGRAQR